MLAALERYERIAESGGWPVIPPGPTIRPGSDDPRVPLLVERLAATGDLTSDAQVDSNAGNALSNAVLRFQTRHGLEPDMLVGKKTLRAMNVTVAERLSQLRTNLERIPEVFRDDRTDFLLVNVPAYEAYLVRGGEIVWAERAIIGEPETKTPLFESAISHVVLNPTWTVPRKIAIEELVPKIREDPTFLSRGGYELVDTEGGFAAPADIDWANLHENNFPYTLVQGPGPMNELGRIKFLFPNDYGVCMHDTPSRYLFANSSRALSHGCIRIAQPLELGEHLLEPLGWERGRIDEQIRSGETLTIALPSSLPLQVTYLTARVGTDDTVYFYHDIYGRDIAAEPEKHH
ncbi:MAG: L,D-transpeptidase family protein [Woeseiaceae bacterium]|nr:L,D-transpeptidase family protein [Woeseiaceae bacterium]